jgi:hypothetical protein
MCKRMKIKQKNLISILDISTLIFYDSFALSTASNAVEHKNIQLIGGTFKNDDHYPN